MEIKTESEFDQKLNNTEIYLNSYIKTEVDSTITTGTNGNATKIKDCAEELELTSCNLLRVTSKDDEKPMVNPHSQILGEGESEKEGKFGLFKCTRCPHTAQTKWTLRRHCLLAHKSLFTKCNQCNYLTDKPGLLRDHKRNHDPLAIQHSCPKCKYTTKHKSSLKKHIKLHYPSPTALHCAQCSYATNYKGNLIQHVKIHRNTQLLTCNRCAFTSFSDHEFNAHIKKHDISGIVYVCDICYFSTPNRKIFIPHLRVHSTVKPLKCDQCPFETKYINSLRKHSETHGKMNLLKCDQCGFTVGTESSLKAHIAEHNLYSVDYKCNQCSFTSKSKINVKRHARIHSKFAVVHCNNCTYSANNKESLRQHFRICQKKIDDHLTDLSTEFQCAHCPYITKRRARFKRHTLKHNPENVTKGNQSGCGSTLNLSSPKHKPVGIEFKCIYCGYLTTDKGVYRSHVTDHNASKVFKL
ncbi:zinc finger protein 782-like [Photinus pyralis]|uniref:zinc finger protein 782-like n=1 Tax=Photinus pyralis TaxID=7054 RepID=UPI0012670B92|nr:zinc finger protein 782-like [Photinus pyralis]XP_031345928.1 zinc finger protein 782-like [Photinus pyralis]